MSQEKIQVSCRKSNNCTGEIAAYTQNPPLSVRRSVLLFAITPLTSSQGDEPLINFCAPFFRTDSLSRVIERAKNEKDREIKGDLNSYVNRGYILLREMIHIDKIVKPIIGKSIGDLYIAYHDETGKEAVSKVQGPFLTKLLAYRLRLGGHYVRYWIKSSADNMAWYAVAIYVQKQFGDYPALPFITFGSIERIWDTENGTTEMLQVKDEDL